MSTFCLDADAFINLAKLYPRDPFSRVWDKLEEWVGEGHVISPEEVLEELRQVDDEASEWAVQHKQQLFKPPEEAVQNAVSEVLAKFPGLVRDTQGPPFADPWVVAQAKVAGAVVVANENPAKPGAYPKIPDVCQEFDVPCVKVLDFLRAMDLGY